MSQPISESYPPLFRQRATTTNNFVHFVSESTMQFPASDDPIPVIDFQSINHEELRKACENWGIFRLVKHGIPVTFLDQLHQHVKSLFNLSFESKQALFTSPIAYFWGTPALTPSGLAMNRGPRSHNANWVEGFNVPLNQLSELQTQESMLDSFRNLLEEYGKHQSRLATRIFEAILETLEIGPKQSHSSYLSPATGLLRVYRYPPCCLDSESESEANRAWGMDVHTDSSVISILNQDDVGGLEVYRDNKWLDVKPIPNTLVVHLGDIMQAISDDDYTSVKHRVKVNRWKERISIGYFVFPDADCMIKSSRYRPFTYDDFRAQVQHDLKTVGFKVGLQRLKLSRAC